MTIAPNRAVAVLTPLVFAPLAVSDSKTGGDGVYVKLRSRSLVRDYIRVLR